MSLTPPELKRMVERLRAGEALALEEVSAWLGLRITNETLRPLVASIDQQSHRGEPDLGKVLRFLELAVHAPTGLLWERQKVIGRSRLFVHMLAVRQGESQLTVGVRVHFGSSTIAAAWPELAKWGRDDEENRLLAIAWARVTATDRFTFTAVRAPAAKSAELDEVSLRLAIAESPDDPAPRQVFADWLLERGEPLGEIIRRGETLGKDEAWKRWAGPFARYTSAQAVRGGFITEATMTVAAFKKEGERLFTSHPVHQLRLEVGTTGPQLEQLARCPTLERVRSLCVERGLFTDKPLPLAGLGAGEHYRRLELLQLVHVGHSAADWEELFTTIRAPALREFRADDTVGSPRALFAAARNPSLSGLRVWREDHSRCFGRGLTHAWAEALREVATGFPALEQLNLFTGQLGDAAVLALWGARSRLRLQTLRLICDDLTGAAWKAVAKARGAAQLTELGLSLTGIAAADVEALVIALPIKKLWVLANEADSALELGERLSALSKSRPLTELTVRGQFAWNVKHALGERYLER